MVKIDGTQRKLLEVSLKTLMNARALWGYKVGAAVLAEDGETYGGCNVESWVAGLGTCAERCAIDHAVLHGNRKIRMMALVLDADSASEPRPCGACLQYIYEFSINPEVKVLMAKAGRGKILWETLGIKSLSELFPFPYKR
jgi:cytidine deaminase